MLTIPYGHQWMTEDDIQAVVDVLRSEWITQGLKIKEFEDKLCRYTGANYAVTVSSGTAALHIACLAAGIGKGDEVVTSPITFVASANCVLHCGGRPVFADIQEDTVNIDPPKIKQRISKKTAAIIPVHFAGHPCDMNEIHRIAKKHNLLVIEDACHALGAEYKLGGRWLKVGSCRHSDMAVFSFHPVKSITTGEGGAVLTNRRDLYERLLVFRNHGITKEGLRFKAQNAESNGGWFYEMQELGLNYRLTDFQCALGVSQLKKLDKFIKRRREIAQIYNQELSKIDRIELPVEREDVKSSRHLYYLRIRDKGLRIRVSELKVKRYKIFNYLRKNGIGVQVHYIPVHIQPYYRKRLGYKYGDYPEAERYYRRAVTLPLFPKMKYREVERIVEAVKKVITLHK